MKVKLYTANVGGYDDVAMPGVEVVTDAPIVGNSRKKSRWIKTHPHVLFPDYDVWIYLDANIRLVISVEDLLKKHKGFISARPHPERNCAYDEVLAVGRFGFDTKENLQAVLSFYLAKDFPRHQGLFENGLLVMSNTEEVKSFLSRWWELIDTLSLRDQLSASYVQWEQKKKFTPISRDYVRYGGHKKDRVAGGFSV